MITKHVLAEDFPEFAEKISTLRTHDNHFKKLVETFDSLDDEIFKIESDTEPACDATLNELRMKRVHVKDEMYQYLLHR